jgi:hypothetical protein
MTKSTTVQFPNLEALIDGDYDLTNFIQMGAFLMTKEWEAKKNNGYTIIKSEELQRINEFISCFNDLTHNSSMLRERLLNEGYTNYVKVIEKARSFM